MITRIEIHLTPELTARLQVLLDSQHRLAKNFCEHEILNIIVERTDKVKGKWVVKPNAI